VTAALCEAFVAALRSGRDELNASFAHARHVYPALDAGDFSAFLASAVDPLVRVVAAARPECAYQTARTSYELGLELVGQRLAGAHPQGVWMSQAWTRVLCAVPGFVAVEPRRVIGAVCNAVHHLASSPGARPDRWIAAMQELAPDASGADHFLALGQVLAWQSGLAHFRAGALDVAERLPAPLALAAVGAARTGDWPAIRARLRADPWFVPGRAGSTGIAARVGGFRGFGGLFAEPPRVAAVGEQLFVRSGEECWFLAADAFGASFHRATEAESAEAKPSAARLPPSVALPAWAGAVTSVAETPTTIAVSAALTHALLFFARSAA
jgi:hypothetical protein